MMVARTLIRLDRRCLMVSRLGGCSVLLWCLLGASGGPLGVSWVFLGWPFSASRLAPACSWVHSGHVLGASGAPSAGHGPGTTRPLIFDDLGAGRLLAQISASGAPSARHGPDMTRSLISDDFGAGRLLAQISASGASSAEHLPAYPFLKSPLPTSTGTLLCSGRIFSDYDGFLQQFTF